MLYPKHSVGQALRLDYRFNLSHSDIEDILAERDYRDTLCIDAVFAGMPDNPDQRQTALSMVSC